MFSTKESVCQLAALLRDYGIRDMVLCPGSRNIPLVQTFASLSQFRCVSATDERSAGFYALGVIQQTSRPVVVCCTSGSALLNIHPAVCEAYYQRLPLLVVSADRPVAWIGQMDGQTLPQSGVFGGLVRKSVTLPEEAGETSRWYVNRLINEALHALTSPVKGPVHIDVPVSEPFFDFSRLSLPVERRVTQYVFRPVSSAFPSSLKSVLRNSRRILLVIGQRSCFGEEKKDGLDSLLQALRQKGVAVLSEQLGNVDGSFRHVDEFLVSERRKDMRPDLVISLGGHLVSKRLKKWLREGASYAHWLVSEDDSMPDVFQHLTATVKVDDYTFLSGMAEALVDYQSDYQRKWAEISLALDKAKKEIALSYCDIQVVRLFVDRLNSLWDSLRGSVAQVANSNMVRTLGLFDLPEGMAVYCNRGVNGIEGSLSTACGFSLYQEKGLTFCLIGDLSFFYDMNALWHGGLPSTLRVLLINNGNGQIFHQLPGLRSPYLKSYISASHSFHAKGWAEEAGFDYLRVDNLASLTEAWTLFFSLKAEKPVLLEVITDSKEDERNTHEFYNTLKQIHYE